MELPLIRPAQEPDITAIIKTFSFPWATPEATKEKWAVYFSEQLQKIRSIYLVEKENELLGYGSLLYVSHNPHFNEGTIPEINDVWIQEKWRQHGYGESLIRFLENVALTKGYKKTGLGVGLYGDYGHAQRLYAKLGYIPDGKGITYNSSPVIPGEIYPVDDELLLWLIKTIS